MPEALEFRHLVSLRRRRKSQYQESISTWMKSHTCSCPYLGIALAAISSLFFSLCSVIVKGLVDINPIELAMFRFVGVLLPAIPIVIYKEKDVFPKGKRIIIVLRCLVGCAGLVLSFYSFRHMALADASVIIFSTPVFVAIFARLFLKEACGLFNVLTIILTLCGVLLITRPPLIFGDALPSLVDDQIDGGVETNYNLWGPAAALASTLFGANAYVLLRALKGLHFSVIMTNFGGFALVYTFSIAWWVGALCLPCENTERLLVIALALFSFSGQILLTLALQFEEAGPVSIARSADIVFAFIWQILFFKEVPNRFSVLGAVLVVSSVILSGLRKWALALPRDSSKRKKLRLLTGD